MLFCVASSLSPSLLLCLLSFISACLSRCRRRHRRRNRSQSISIYLHLCFVWRRRCVANVIDKILCWTNEENHNNSAPQQNQYRTIYHCFTERLRVHSQCYWNRCCCFGKLPENGRTTTMAIQWVTFASLIYILDEEDVAWNVLRIHIRVDFLSLNCKHRFRSMGFF